MCEISFSPSTLKFEDTLIKPHGGGAINTSMPSMNIKFMIMNDDNSKFRAIVIMFLYQKRKNGPILKEVSFFLKET